MMNAFAKIRFFFILSLVGATLFSCDPNEELPPELILEYLGCQHFGDSTGVTALKLQVRFKKGDGNLGIDPHETGKGKFVGKYENNLFVQVFDRVSLTDTIYEPMTNPNSETGEDEDIVFKFTVPVVSESRTASVKGTIDFIVEGFDFTNGVKRDSKHGIVRFQIYMYDRDLNQSNTVTTIPDIRIR
ncbi:MAG: hypothetical protein LBP96_01700 [Bacteroidales bacterium]|jgi:hypothetical protein|nr:hypothetical protein [Bacteroidales bacterium]